MTEQEVEQVILDHPYEFLNLCGSYPPSDDVKRITEFAIENPGMIQRLLWKHFPDMMEIRTNAIAKAERARYEK